MAVSVFAPDPGWCTGHYEPSSREAFHQHSFGRTWGTFDEKVRLGLVRFDCDGRAGDERIEIQYLTDVTEVQGSVGLPDDEAVELAGHILRALAVKKNAGGGRQVFLLRCLYEAGKAFLAAVRIARTSSPRTASSHSRSISSA